MMNIWAPVNQSDAKKPGIVRKRLMRSISELCFSRFATCFDSRKTKLHMVITRQYMEPTSDTGMPRQTAYKLVKTFSQPPVIEHGGMTPMKCSTLKYVASAKPTRAIIN